MNTHDIYIAGPMRGFEDYNRAAFNRAETLLEQGGWAIYNPVRLELEFCARRNLLPEELEADEGLLAELMEWELGFAAAADYIYLLKGWQNSEGAKKELETALRHGAKILLEGSALFPEALEGLPGDWAGIGRAQPGHQDRPGIGQAQPGHQDRPSR